MSFIILNTIISGLNRNKCSLKTLLLCAIWLARVDAANILAIFPTASYSHQMPLLALPRALAEAGHNLTVITPNPFREKIPNYTEIDISFSYNYWNKKTDKDEDSLIHLQGKIGPLEAISMFLKGADKISELVVSSPTIQNFIRYLDVEKPKFDLVLYEEISTPVYFGFLHKLGHPPMITITTFALLTALDFSGTEFNPSFVPDVMLGMTNKMNFWERLRNFLFTIYVRVYVGSILGVSTVYDEMLRKYFGPNCPSTKSIIQNRSLHLSSSSWLFEYARPVFPNTIHVGPMHIGTTKPLPKDLENWIQGAKNGFIYFSFGSNMKSASLDPNTKFAILAAFSQFPEYRIIWKWEDEVFEGLPSNVLCRKWLPQQDILAHPNIKLFITQGGLQSLQEAVHFQVPMVVVPFFGDQPYNAKIISRLGIGSRLEFEDISTDTLHSHIHEILHNESYRKSMQRVSTLSKTQMMSPRDTAVWWVEYVLKAGGNVDHLKPDYFHLNWFQFYGLDVLLVLLAPVVLALYGVYRLVLILSNMSRGKLKTQ